MLPVRRKAKMAAVDGLMKMLGNMDSQRMDTMTQRMRHEDDSADLEGSAQLANKNDAHQVLQAKGSDSDMNENELDQPKAAPPNSDPSDGDVEGNEVAEDDADWQPLRDAAMQGDSTSRRILDLFAEEPDNDEASVDYDSLLEGDENASETASSPMEGESEEREEGYDRDFQSGEEDVPGGDRSTGQSGAGVRNSYPKKDFGSMRRAGGYVGGDEGEDMYEETSNIRDPGMRPKLPRRRR